MTQFCFWWRICSTLGQITVAVLFQAFTVKGITCKAHIWSKLCTHRTNTSMFIHSFKKTNKKNLSRTLEFGTAALLWALPSRCNISLMKHKGPVHLQRLFGLFKSKLCFCGWQVWGIGNSASGPFRLTKKALKQEPEHTRLTL